MITYLSDKGNYYKDEAQKQVVEVLVGGDEDRVKKFVEYVKSEKPPLAVVEKIEVEDYADEILPIDDFRKVLNSEQLNKIIQVGLVMLQKQDMMLEKQDMMLQKQDKTIEAIHETKTHLGEKIDLLRVDLKSYMDERFSKMEEEIKKIKAKIGME